MQMLQPMLFQSRWKIARHENTQFIVWRDHNHSFQLRVLQLVKFRPNVVVHPTERRHCAEEKGITFLSNEHAVNLRPLRHHRHPQSLRDGDNGFRDSTSAASHDDMRAVIRRCTLRQPRCGRRICLVIVGF